MTELNPFEIEEESAFREVRERVLEIPPSIEPVPPQTFAMLVDADVPAIVLAKALAAHKLTLRYWRGQLVLTHRPRDFA